MSGSYKITYKYEKQNYTIPINIPLLFNKVIKKNWFQRTKILAYPENEQRKIALQEAEMMAGQMGELMTQIYIWEKKHTKDFKSQMGNTESIKRIWLDTAKKKVDPKGQDKPLLVRLTSSISSEFKKMTKQKNLEINEKNKPTEAAPRGEEKKKVLPVKPMKIVRADTRKPIPCPGRICRGSIITGRPANAWTTAEYQGYVLGEKKKIGKYIGWPVIYNYNNKFPWFGLFVMEKQAMTSEEIKFKKWFNKYLELHKSEGKKDGRANALKSMRDKHKINIPQDLVDDFPIKLENKHWRGGKKKSKKNIKMKMRKTRKGGSKILNALQKAKIINVMKDKKIQQYVKENKHKTFTLKKKLGGPKKFRSFTRKRKKKKKNKEKDSNWQKISQKKKTQKIYLSKT